MDDIIQALKIALDFTPEADQAPGLEVVLFEFKSTDDLHIFTCDGQMMVRMSLSGLELPEDCGEFYASIEAVRKMTEDFQHAEDPKFTVWGDDMMVMDGDQMATLKRVDGGFKNNHHKLFTRYDGESKPVHVDSDQLFKMMSLCSTVLTAYKHTGPSVKMFVKDGYVQLTPGIMQDLRHLVSIDVVLSGLDL